MLNKFKTYQPWLTILARLILGGVLLAAGASKVGNLQKSAMAVRAYEMLPVELANFLGYALPRILSIIQRHNGSRCCRAGYR